MKSVAAFASAKGGCRVFRIDGNTREIALWINLFRADDTVQRNDDKAQEDVFKPHENEKRELVGKG